MAASAGKTQSKHNTYRQEYVGADSHQHPLLDHLAFGEDSADILRKFDLDCYTLGYDMSESALRIVWCSLSSSGVHHHVLGRSLASIRFSLGL